MNDRRAMLVEAAEAAAELERRRKARPLAYATLWARDEPRTSQQRLVARFLGGGLHTLVALGGNRTGKTELGAQLTVAHALGGDHPDVVAWARRNGLDAASIPRGPGKVCASALTSGDSLRYQRDKLDRYLPAGSTWYNRYGQGEAWVRLPNGGVILCKSNDQGRRSYQGDSWRFLWLDEEHDEEIYDEGVVRLLDQGGRSCLTMTPLRGLTWVWSRWIDDRAEATREFAALRADSHVGALYMEDNPHLPPEEVARLIAAMPEHQRQARLRGGFVDPKGKRFPSYMVVPRAPINPKWIRYAGIDWGARSPHAIWLAEDRDEGTLVVYDEVAPRSDAAKGEPAIVEQDFIRAIGEREKVHPGPAHFRVADSEAPGAIVQAARMGVPMMPAAKGAGSVERGLALLDALLSTPPEGGRPRLVIMEHCRELLREIAEARWKPSRPGEEPQIDPTCNDHGLDAVRYILLLREQMGRR